MSRCNVDVDFIDSIMFYLLFIVFYMIFALCSVSCPHYLFIVFLRFMFTTRVCYSSELRLLCFAMLVIIIIYF